VTDDRLDYETFVAEALRGVVRRSLRLVVRRGLPGQHHFYISVRSNAPGVRLPDRLRAQFPDQITLVLQHQFADLNVDEQGFAVTLSFGGKLERIAVPFTAVTAFVDPSVDFGLPIPFADAEGKSSGLKIVRDPVEAVPEAETAPIEAPPVAERPSDAKPAAVVQFDKFRKK
jgi:uncharacterized protein